MCANPALPLPLLDHTLRSVCAGFYNCAGPKSSCSIHDPWYNNEDGHPYLKIGGHPDNGSPVAWHTWGSGERKHACVAMLLPCLMIL